jgi:hypothetical protein
MADESYRTRYRTFKVPDFKSTIPSHLLGKLGDQERYIVETLSKMEQQNTWIMLTTVEINTAVIELDERQGKVEVWKERITSKWAMVLGVVVLLVPVVLKTLIERYWVKTP